jgi:protein TonB
MKRKNTNILITILLALLVNVLLFIFIPALSKIEQQRHERMNPGMAVTLSDKDLPEKKPPKEIKEKPKEKKPKKISRPEKGMLDQKKDLASKPKMDFKAPKMDIPMDLDVEGGMAIQQPQTGIKRKTGGPGVPAAFEFEEVDQPPRAVRKVMPVYPHKAKQEKINGKVILRFIVNRKGNVENAKVVFSQPKGVFDAKALEAIRKWKFKPGKYEQQAVRTWVMLPIEFEL